MDEREKDEVRKLWEAMTPVQRHDAYHRLLEIKRELDRLEANPEAMMQFLLEQHIDDHLCDGCTGWVPPEDKFCEDCGTANPGFNEEAFTDLFDDSHAEVVRNDCHCEQPHRGQITKFCPVCGDKLNPTAEDYRLHDEEPPPDVQ